MVESTLVPLQRITGTFAPKRQESLRPELARWIGYQGQFQVYWLIDEEDGGPYVGQAALLPVDRDALDGYWVPEEDLDGVCP